MNLDEYLQHDGLGLGRLVREGEVTATELLELAIQQLDRVNPSLNAVVHRMDGEARETARAMTASPGAEAPFLGVPFLVKDLMTMVAGHPHTSGSRFLRDFIPDHDSEVVRRFRRAGLVILGKTNAPEFGLMPYTEPEHFGPCRNPWDTARTPGGSSGGAGAAVAAGVAPLASASDGGGSIRIPASCCGLFGLKPTRGRVPTGPDQQQVWRGLATAHVVTRSVRDSAAMLDLISGRDVGAPYDAPRPDGRFLDAVGEPPPPLRVALTSEPLLGSRIDPACRAAVEAAGSLLQGLGHRVEEAAPIVDAERFRRDFTVLMCSETWADLRDAEAAVGSNATPADVEPESLALALMGERLSAGEYAGALRSLERAGRDLLRFFERYDVLVTPTLAEPPVPVGSLRAGPLERAMMKGIGRLKAGWFLDLLGTLERTAAEGFEFTPYTPLFNVSGQPAMSVPLHWSDEGLPIGVHVAGRFGEDETLLRLAGQVERARPWFDRLPAWIKAG